MNDLDDHLAAIAAGDARAFARWVAAAEPRIRLSLATFAAVVDVEAVVQETLLRIWQVAGRVEPDGRGDSLLRFAVRVAHNLAVDETRRRRLRPIDDDALARLADADLPAPPPPDPLLQAIVRRCREALPKRPAAALAARLSGAGARTDAELAGQLGMQLNTFLKNFGRARALMATCLRRRGVEVGVPT